MDALPDGLSEVGEAVADELEFVRDADADAEPDGEPDRDAAVLGAVDELSLDAD